MKEDDRLVVFVNAQTDEKNETRPGSKGTSKIDPNYDPFDKPKEKHKEKNKEKTKESSDSGGFGFNIFNFSSKPKDEPTKKEKKVPEK